MPGFAGVDTSSFPGADVLAWLKANSNLSWCGYYLAPAPSHHDIGWMGNREALQAAGWGLAPTYLGQQLGGLGSHQVSGAQGTIDGADAAEMMANEGFVQGSFVYLDLEDGPPFVSPRTDYVAAWVASVQSAGYRAGVYCSHTFAADVHVALPAVRIWAYRVETAAPHPFPGTNFPDSAPAGCGYPGAYMWQLGQNCQIAVPGAPSGVLLVDLSSSVATDPSAP
ncbi:glycoside hydrolase domain-containing protein [Phenylobacterium sp.]|uniref:glycoside hydrolase domain-containing protein n=1 Tax=Phenylobacterium sp. TaxID=1871053 RepID=UPI002C9B36C6|nr:glycoside hydrolase domain-containing protein [Phenylobacterium sp.]HLZ77188.1 glycoside hydrolase domain-containing protein [Phenylobacterium sp.]